MGKKEVSGHASRSVRGIAESWGRWHAYAAESVRWVQEFQLYSDSCVRGVAREFGPYHVVNLAAGNRRETALARPVIALRIQLVAGQESSERYVQFGGRLSDEISALMSLVLGIRLQAGAVTRSFDFSETRTFGIPRAQAEVDTPVLLPGAWTPIIAHAQRTVDLSELDLLSTFPSLSQEMAVTLVRCARLYQEGLWLSERQAWLTWLLLVSAVETAAGTPTASESDDSAVEQLREFAPRLAQVASQYGENCLKEVAAIQAPLMGATRRFVDFLDRFMPAAPSERPSSCRVEWTGNGLRKALKEVYGFRSRYLHGGQPFPWQLCIAPEPCGDAPAERPSKDLTAGDEGLPIGLHVFERLVRGALLAWWQSARLVAP